jgi:hypothetical protein
VECNPRSMALFFFCEMKFPKRFDVRVYSREEVMKITFLVFRLPHLNVIKSLKYCSVGQHLLLGALAYNTVRGTCYSLSVFDLCTCTVFRVPPTVATIVVHVVASTPVLPFVQNPVQ